MRLIVVCVALAFLALPARAQDLPADVFQRDRALRGATGIERLTTDLLLGKRHAEAHIIDWLARHPDAPVTQRRDGWLALCAAHFREQRYAEGVPVCTRGEALHPGSAASMIDLMRILAQAAPASWSAPGVRIPLTKGLATVRHGDVSIQALLDSGAEVAFVSETVARQLGGRPLTGEATIGTTTTPVAGGLVLFDELQIGDAHLRNVAAVVLSDEQSAYAELTLVLHLAAFTSLRRAAYVDNGATLLLGDAAPRVRGRSTPLYWDESGVGFAVDFARERCGVHFDTGSRRTWLFPAASAALSESEQGSRAPFERRIGGLGGERVEQASKFRNVTMTIAGRAWRFDELEMAEADENGEAARIGTNLFERFGTVALDFERMRMSVAD
jgi:hypothetical protein